MEDWWSERKQLRDVFFGGYVLKEVVVVVGSVTLVAATNMQATIL